MIVLLFRFVFYALSICRWDVFLTIITFQFEATCTTTTSTRMDLFHLFASTCTTRDLLVYAISSVATHCELDPWT